MSKMSISAALNESYRLLFAGVVKQFDETEHVSLQHTKRRLNAAVAS